VPSIHSPPTKFLNAAVIISSRAVCRTPTKLIGERPARNQESQPIVIPSAIASLVGACR
jgi:hypothetical protein